MPLILNGTTGVSGVDGTAGTPAIKGTDTDTGVVYGANTVQIATNGTTAVTVDSNQRLGVGTTTPAYPIDVTGQLRATTGCAVSADGSAFTPSGLNAIPNYGVGYITSTSTVPVSGFGGISFYTSQTERARIDSSGNLLVGTTSVGVGRTTIYSNTNSQSAIDGRIIASGDVGTRALYLSKFDNNTTTSQIFVQFAINNGFNGSGQINANGANAAAFGSYSDARLKENIVDLPSQLPNILALRPVEFDYIESEGGGHQIGFIAQEMQNVYPDAVGERSDGMLTVTAWSKTEARLVKAIQELSAKLDAAEARIAALEAK